MFIPCGFVHVVIQKMLETQEQTTKQLIREVEQVTERLTETYPCDKCKVEFCSRLCYRMTQWAEIAKDKLAEYKTAEDEGRMVVLPCDTVYFIWNKSSGISYVRAKSILDLSLREILGIDKDGRYWSVKEEAEKALKEMEGRLIADH